MDMDDIDKEPTKTKYYIYKMCCNAHFYNLNYHIALCWRMEVSNACE